nr:hypothetical protein [Anaerolineae bacterium]
MAHESRFDFAAIARVTGIIVVVTGIIGFAVPALLTIALKLGHTGTVSGHEVFRFGYWAVAWGLTVWQGSWMLRRVHERIIDDMMVVAVLAAVLLLIVKFVIALVYEPTNRAGELLPLVTSIDVGGALMLILVAFIGARVNKY